MTISIEQFKKDPDDLFRRTFDEGEEIVITKNGTPVGKFIPFSIPMDQTRKKRAEEAVKRIRALRKGNILGPDLSVRQLIEEGRRF